jgi:glycosyltransferase involved in cell wall biosynthesis
MKIVQLISSGGYYGAENMLANLLAGLKEANEFASLWIFDNTQNSHLELAARARALGVDVIVIPCSGKLDFKTVRILRRNLRTLLPVVIHTHGYKADLYGLLASIRSGAILMATCHNWTKGSRKLRFYASVDKLVLLMFDYVVAVSKAVADELRAAGVPSARIGQIDNGVPSSENRAAMRTSAPVSELLPARQLVIGMAGRLVAEKGVSHFLYAAHETLSLFPNTRFVIAGEGPGRTSFEQEAARLGISNEVLFVGHVADMDAFYLALDIFVLPSLREGLPMSILEALAAGKAVVASRVGAIPEVIRDGETGLLFDAQDREALAEAMGRVAGDEALRRRIGHSAMKLIRDSYSAEKMTSRYRQLYQTLSGARHSPEAIVDGLPPALPPA